MRSYLNDEERKKYEGDPSEGGGPEDPEENGTNPGTEEPSGFGYEVPAKTNVLEQFRLSIVKPLKLIGLSELKVSRFIRYMLFLGFLVTFMTYAISTIATVVHFGGFSNLFNNRIPDFTVQNGKLNAKEPFTIGLGTYEIKVDTKAAEVPEDSLGTCPVTIAIGQEKVQIYLAQNGLHSIMMDAKVSEFFPEGFNRKQLIDAIPGFYLALILTGIVLMVGVMIKYTIASLIYMILVWPVAKHSGLFLTKGNVFRLCFYAQTVGILLVNVNTAFGELLPGMIVSAVGIFISIRYAFKAFTPFMRFGRDE